MLPRPGTNFDRAGPVSRVKLAITNRHQSRRCSRSRLTSRFELDGYVDLASKTAAAGQRRCDSPRGGSRFGECWTAACGDATAVVLVSAKSGFFNERSLRSGDGRIRCRHRPDNCFSLFDMSCCLSTPASADRSTGIYFRLVATGSSFSPGGRPAFSFLITRRGGRRRFQDIIADQC